MRLVGNWPENKPMSSSNPLFPVFLKIEHLHTLVVGGGYVALEKSQALLNNGPQAKLRLVAPMIRTETQAFLAHFPQVECRVRGFLPEDLEGVDLVICATDSPALHQEIRQLAKAKGLLVNVADTPDLCDFYLGSIVQKGDLKIAISTNGKSPTMAKRLKEWLNAVIPDEIHTSLQQLEAYRKKISGDFQEKIRQLNEITKDIK